MHQECDRQTDRRISMICSQSPLLKYRTLLDFYPCHVLLRATFTTIFSTIHRYSVCDFVCNNVWNKIDVIFLYNMLVHNNYGSKLIRILISKAQINIEESLRTYWLTCDPTQRPELLTSVV